MHPLAGRKQSPEHVAKRVAAIRATGVYDRSRFAALNKERVGEPLSEEHKKAIAASMVGKKNALGCKRSEEFRRKLSEHWTNNPQHNHWIDGKCHERGSERTREMGRLEYRLWRTSVFERDGFTCVQCNVRGGNLEADHIKPWINHPELRYNVSNGRTLCKPCHLKTPTHGINAARA